MPATVDPTTVDPTTLPDANTLLGSGSATTLPDAHALLGSGSNQNSSPYTPPAYSSNAPFYEKSMLNDLGQCTGRECGEEISHYLPQSATSLDQPQNFVQPDSHGNYPEGTIMHVAPDPDRGRFNAGHYFVVHYINGVPHRLESNVIGHDVVSDSRPLSPADIDAATRGGVVHAYAPGGMKGVQVASNPQSGLPDANQLLGSTTPPVSDSPSSLPDANALLGTSAPQPEQPSITPHEERLFQSMNAKSPFLGPENMLAGKTAWGGPLPTNAQANDIGFNQGMNEIDAATNQNTALELGLPKNATPAQINAAIKALDHPAWSQNFPSKQQPFDINQTFDTQGQPGSPVHPSDASQAPAPANAKPWYKQIIPNIRTGLTNLYNQYEASPEGHLPSLLQPQSPTNTLKAVEGIGGQIVGLIGGTVNLFAAPIKPIMRYTEAGMAYQDPQFSEQISRTAGKQTDAAVNTLASAVPFLGNESAHMAIDGLTSMSRGDMRGANKLMSAIPQFGTELRDDPFGQIGQAAVVFAPLILHGLKVAGSNAALAKTLGDTADAAKANEAVASLTDHANNITENSPAAAQAFTDATHDQNQPLTPDIQHIADAEAEGIPYTATVEQMAQYHEMPVDAMKAKIDRSVARGVTQDLGDGTYKFVPAAARATAEASPALPAIPGTYSPRNAAELAPVLQSMFNTDEPHAQALAQLYDARAKTWAAENNTTPAQWYATKQFVNGEGPTGDTLNQSKTPLQEGESYFLRFPVENAQSDLQRGTSAHFLDENSHNPNPDNLPIYEDDRGKWGILPGLSGYELEADNIHDAIKESKELETPYGDIHSQDYAIYKGKNVGNDNGPGGAELFKPSEVAYDSTQNLFQKNKASVTFHKDGTAIVRALSNPDVSSAIHELGHIIRRDLPASDQTILKNHYGVQDSKWTRPQEEKFARHFEGYVREGVAPTEGLKPVFAKLSAALKQIYQRWRGTAHPEVKAVLDRALGKGSEGTEKAPVAKSATTEAVPKPTEPKTPPAEDDKYAESLNLVRNTMNEQQKAIAREQMGLAGVHKPDSVSFAEQRIRGNALGLTNEYVRGKVKGEIPKQLSEDQRGDYLNSLRSLMQHNLNKVEELSRVPAAKRSVDFTKALTKATEDYQATLQDYSPIVNRMGRSFGNLADNARAFEAASRGDIFKEQSDVVKLGKTKRAATAWDRGATNTTYTQKAAQDAIAKLQAKGLIKDSNTLYQSVGKEPLRANSPLKDPETAAALRELGGYYLEATGNWNNWTRAMVSHVPSLTDADLRNIHDSIRADVEAKTGVVQSPDAPTVTMAKTLARRLGPNAADIIKAIPDDMQESISNKMAARLPFSKQEDAAIAKAFSETIKGVKPNGVRRYPQLDAAMLAARKTYNAQKALSDKWKAMQSGRLAIRDGILKTLPSDKIADFSKEFAQIPNDASDSSFKRLAEAWNKWGPGNEGNGIFTKTGQTIPQKLTTNGHLLAQLIRAGYLTGTHVIGKVLVGHDAAVLRNEMLLRPIMHFLPGEYSPLPSAEGLKASGKAALSGIGHTLKTFGGVTENPNLSVLRGENGANPPSQLHSPEITTGLPWADAILRAPQRIHFELPRAASGAEFQSGLDDYASRNAHAQKLADPSIDEAKAKAELIANPTPAMKEAAHNYAAEAMWFNDSAMTWVMSQIDSGLKRFEKVSPPAAAVGKYLRSSQIPFARIASNAIGDAIETSMGYTGVPTAYKLAKFKGQNLIAMNKAIDDAMRLGTDRETATSDAKAQYGKLSPEQQISVKKTIAKAIIGGIAVAIGVGLHRQGILTAPGDPAKYDPGSLQIKHKSIDVGYYEPIASPFLHGALIDQMAQKWALGEPPSFADIANLYMKPLENAPLVGPVSALAEGTDKGLARFVANLIPTPTIVAETAATFDPTHSVRAKQSVLDYKRNQFPGKIGRNGLPIQTVPQKYVNNEPTLRENDTIPESAGLGLGPKTLPLRPGYLEDEKTATQAEATAYQRAVLRALAKRRVGSQ